MGKWFCHGWHFHQWSDKTIVRRGHVYICRQCGKYQKYVGEEIMVYPISFDDVIWDGDGYRFKTLRDIKSGTKLKLIK